MRCFMSVTSFNSAIHQPHVLLQIYGCIQLNSVLFFSLWSTMLVVINIDSLMRLLVLTECTNMTDGQTPHDSIASCSNNRLLRFISDFTCILQEFDVAALLHILSPLLANSTQLASDVAADVLAAVFEVIHNACVNHDTQSAFSLTQSTSM